MRPLTTEDSEWVRQFIIKHRGDTLVIVHHYAVYAIRMLSPRIPLIGNNQFPLHDEIELEMMLER